MRSAHLLALVVLVLVLCAAYACVTTARELQAQLLGPLLRTP